MVYDKGLCYRSCLKIRWTQCKNLNQDLFEEVVVSNFILTPGHKLIDEQSHPYYLKLCFLKIIHALYVFLVPWIANN